MRRFRPLLLLLLVGTAACDVIAPDTQRASFPGMETLYRASGLNGAGHLTVLADGSILVAGTTEGGFGPTDAPRARPLFLRISPNGAITDTTVYHHVRYGATEGAVPYREGLAVLIEEERPNQENPDVPNAALYRAAADGTREQRLFKQADTFLGRSALLRTRDGGFLLTRFRIHDEQEDLVKLDSTGAVVWRYRMPAVQFVRDVTETPNGDLFVVGARDSSRFELARLSTDGREQWRRTYGSDTLRNAVAAATVGNGVAVLGQRADTSAVPGLETVVVTRFDGGGDRLWERAYADGDVQPTALAARPSGGLVFGYTEKVGTDDRVPGRRRAFLIGLNPEGRQQWRRRFGAQGQDTYISAVAPGPSGSVVAVGSTGPVSTRFQSDLLVTRYDLK